MINVSKTAIQHAGIYVTINVVSAIFLALFEDKLSYFILGLPFTFIFLATNYFEYKSSKKLFFIQPPALFGVFMFFYVYVSYFLVIFFESQLPLFDSKGLDPIYYTRTLMLSNIATHSLWVGFRLFPNFKLPLDKLGEYSFVRKRYIAIIIGLAVLANLYGIQSGAIGFINRGSESVEKTASFVQYIRILMDLSYLGFVMLVWYYYDIKKYRPLIILVFMFLFLLGLLYGSKSISVFYALYFGLVLFFKTFTINYKLLLVFVISIFATYLIIEPFRAFYGRTGRKFSTGSVVELASFYRAALSNQHANDKKTTAQVGLHFLSRISYTIPLARVMDYADKHNNYLPPSASPVHILFSPVYSFVPRAIWKSKPEANFSLWVGTDVMYLPKDGNSAIGVTPQGYCYMAGGYVFTVGLFLIIGLIQCLIYRSFYENPNYIPLYIFLLLRIHTFDSLLWAAISGLTRTILIYFLIYYFLSTKMRLIK